MQKTTVYLEDNFMRDLRRLAAKLKKRDRLKLPDALVLASAVLADSVFLTGDMTLIKMAQRHGKARNPFQ